MSKLVELQEALQSNSPEVLSNCPSIIAEVLETLSLETITEQIIPAIKSLLISNFDDVSDSMLQALPCICQILQKITEDGASLYICKNIFPMFLDWPDEYDEDVVSLVADSITAIIESLASPNIITDLIPFLTSISSSNKKTLRAISAMTLEYCGEIIDINPEFDKISLIIIQLATDSSPCIRSHVPSIVTIYINTITDPNHRSQLTAQIFLLAHDKSPEVRRSVIENLFEFSKKVDLDTKILTVEPVLSFLIDDTCVQNRMLALARFAPILSTLSTSSSEEIVKKYCHCLLSEEENVAYSVAFAFSAAALSLGAARFNKELFPAFSNAIQSYDLRVRRTLSFSLETYAQLFTPSDLCIAVSSILKDMPYVSIGVISNLSTILPFVDDKQSLVFCLLNPSSKYAEWRMRIKVAEQLRKCKDYFDNQLLLNAALELIEDDVAVVRKQAAISLADLLNENDLKKLKQLSESDNHWTRLCAAEICGLVKFKNSPKIIKILKKLVKDNVFAVKNVAKRLIDEASSV